MSAYDEMQHQMREKDRTPLPNAPEVEQVRDIVLDLSFEFRAEAVLSAAFGGMHHVYSLKKQPAPHPYWSCIHSGYLSTFDFDVLTKLVLAAHHYCVRVEVSNGGPRSLKIMLHPRASRDGGFSQRHPTIEQAIAAFKK